MDWARAEEGIKKYSELVGMTEMQEAGDEVKDEEADDSETNEGTSPRPHSSSS